jgi:DNA polymerase I-like protein with 3'-5' exonuclease and polymerase domains
MTMRMTSSVILDEGVLREVVDYFLTQDAFAFDVETWGDTRKVCHLNEVLWLSMATKGCSVVIPMGHPIGTKVIGEHKEQREYGGTGPRAGKSFNATIVDYEPPPDQLRRELVFDILRPLFFSTKRKSAHGAVFDLASTAKYFGEVVPGPYNDTVVQSWLLDENRKLHGLKHLTKDIYHFTYDNEEVGRCIEKYPFATVAHYSYCDALYAWLLMERFTPQITAQGLSRVYDLEMDVLNVLVGMRLAGSHVDVSRLKELKKELTVKRDQAKQELLDIAGPDFKPNSYPQKQKLLYLDPPHGQGLTPWKRAMSATPPILIIDKYGNVREVVGKARDVKNGAADWASREGNKKVAKQKQAVVDNQLLEVRGCSTDDETLQGYPTNPLARKIRAYQEVNKLLSTYVLAYLGNPAKDKPCQVYDDRIYTELVQYGTTTRRFSCREPNLQNIPRPDKDNPNDYGTLIRGIWDTEPGWQLVIGDYGQIELVVFAHFAGEGALFDGFMNGIDPHQNTADLVGIPRQLAKTLNFTMSYGAGGRKVSSLLGVEYDEGRIILEDHQRAFPELYALKEDIIDTCRQRRPPHVRTLLGGMRRLPMIHSPDKELRARAERQAVSSVIQGSAADLLKLAMVRADSLLGEQCPDTQIVLSVHDELVLYSPEYEAEKARDVLQEAMLGPEIQSLIRVPLTADIKIVDRWSDAK